MRLFTALFLVPLLLSSGSASAATFNLIPRTLKPSLRAPSITRSPIRTGKIIISSPLSGFQCPSVPSGKALLLPSPPYDTEQGDCALVGQGEAVENYLAELERIAQGCRDRAEASWQAVQDARTELDDDIDDLPPPPPEEEEKVKKEETDDSSFRLLETLETMDPLPRICSYPRPLASSSDSIDPYPAEGHYYTDWLQRIGENVARYCRMVDELVEPIAEACEETLEEAQCMLDDPAQGGVSDAMRNSFHSRVSWAMNAARIKHDYVLWYYENTLSIYGWGNFRQYFHEDSIECSNTSQPGLTGISPATIFEKMGLRKTRATSTQSRLKTDRGITKLGQKIMKGKPILQGKRLQPSRRLLKTMRRTKPVRSSLEKKAPM